jgi:hypothetical protein
MIDIDGSDGAEQSPVTQVGVPAGKGVQVGDHNSQHNMFGQTIIETQYVGTQVVQLPPAPPLGQVVAGNIFTEDELAALLTICKAEDSGTGATTR